MIGLPQTGDRPGSAEVDSTLPRMAAEIDGVEVSQANHTGDRGIALCPLFFVDISVYASETLISGNVTATKEKIFMKFDFRKILIVGSAPDALRTASWDTSFFSHIIAINNA
jgi:hypothetical protein